MNVFLVTSVPAFPTIAGNRSRIRALAQGLVDLGHDVTFVLLANQKTRADTAAHQAAFGKDRFVVLKSGNGPLHSRVQHYASRARLAFKRAVRAAGMESGYYDGLDQTWHQAWSTGLTKLAQKAAPQAVVVEYVFNNKAFDAFSRDTRRIVDTHDSFAERHKQYRAKGMTSGYWRSLRTADEVRGLRRADVVLAIQEAEAAGFSAALAADSSSTDNPEVAVVSHILDIADPVSDFATDGSAFYLASNNSSNRVSIHGFIENVLPLVIAEIPQFDLKLVGNICGEVPDHENITKLGRVENLAEVYAQASFSVNPTLLGTGINIKLLDAMAAGVATISTETGLRGLPDAFRDGVVAVGDTDHAGFAAQIIRFARDAELRRKTGAAAHALARKWNNRQLAELSRSLSG